MPQGQAKTPQAPSVPVNIDAADRTDDLFSGLHVELRAGRAIRWDCVAAPARRQQPRQPDQTCFARRGRRRPVLARWNSGARTPRSPQTPGAGAAHARGKKLSCWQRSFRCWRPTRSSPPSARSISGSIRRSTFAALAVEALHGCHSNFTLERHRHCRALHRPDAAVRAWHLLQRRQHARRVHGDAPAAISSRCAERRRRNMTACLLRACDPVGQPGDQCARTRAGLCGFNRGRSTSSPTAGAD